MIPIKKILKTHFVLSQYGAETSATYLHILHISLNWPVPTSRRLQYNCSVISLCASHSEGWMLRRGMWSLSAMVISDFQNDLYRVLKSVNQARWPTGAGNLGESHGNTFFTEDKLFDKSYSTILDFYDTIEDTIVIQSETSRASETVLEVTECLACVL